MTRHHTRTLAALVVLTLLGITQIQAQNPLTAAEAKNHVGERATVCGPVASTHLAARSRGTPTFLNLDKPYPNQVFTIVIWGSDRAKFGDPEESFRNKHICVTGQISSFRGVPEMVAKTPDQIKVQ